MTDLLVIPGRTMLLFYQFLFPEGLQCSIANTLLDDDDLASVEQLERSILRELEQIYTTRGRLVLASQISGSYLIPDGLQDGHRWTISVGHFSHADKVVGTCELIYDSERMSNRDDLSESILNAAENLVGPQAFVLSIEDAV